MSVTIRTNTEVDPRVVLLNKDQWSFIGLIAQIIHLWLSLLIVTLVRLKWNSCNKHRNPIYQKSNSEPNIRVSPASRWITSKITRILMNILGNLLLFQGKLFACWETMNMQEHSFILVQEVVTIKLIIEFLVDNLLQQIFQLHDQERILLI